MRAARWLVAGLFLPAISGCSFESSAIGATGTKGDATGKAGGAPPDNSASASRDDSAGVSGIVPGGSGHETGGSSGNGSGGATGGTNGNATAGSNSSGVAGSNGNATAGSNSRATAGSNSGATAGSNSAAGGMSSSGSSGGNATGGSSTGGTSGSNSATGGAGGTVTLPADGNQLSVCTAVQGQCNKGFACYSPSSSLGDKGRGFCSKLCSEDKDCEGLEPTSAKYVCQTDVTTPVCEIPCKSAADTNTCPSDMTCQQTGVSQTTTSGPGSDPGGGTMPEFHCKYPTETSGPFGPCGDGTHSCDAPLFCTGTSSSPSGTGYCTKYCSSDRDCDPPTSGSIAPTCIIVDPGDDMTPPTKICGLDCPNAKNGCPEHESCMMITNAAGLAMRCEYN